MQSKYLFIFPLFVTVLCAVLFSSHSFTIQNSKQGEEAIIQTEDSSQNIIFILDASGSMWGQVEGKAKIVIAKEVLTDLIQM